MGKRTQYTEEEKIRLRKLVVAYKSIIEDKRSDSKTVVQKQIVWDQITEQHNSSGRHPPRTRVQLKKLWDNIKTRMKKNYGMAIRKTWLDDDRFFLDIRGPMVGSSTSMKSKRRMLFSAEEKEILVKLFTSYQSVIDSKKSDLQSLIVKKDAWDKITDQFNCCSGQRPRTAAQLKKLWDNIKYRMRPQEILQEVKEEDPNFTYVPENLPQDSATLIEDPLTIGPEEKLENEITDEDLMAEQNQVHKFKLKELHMKMTQLERGMTRDEELFTLQKKKLRLEIELLEVKLANEKRKLEHDRMSYIEL